MKGLIAEVKGEVQRKIDEIEEKVQMKVDDVKSEVKGKIKEVEHKVQGMISEIERRLNELEDRPFSFLASPEFMHPRPTIKSLTFDRQTSWTVFKTQFDVVSSTNGWTDFVKASQLVASLRGSTAQVLQGIPSDKLTDLTTIEKALESRFGDSHLMQFYRTELKTRRQKPGESLQELAADVERLMSLAYAECPLDVWESLAAQYFVDAIRDEDTQHSTRLMDAKDLKSSLAYSMKYETARTVSKTSRHVRSIETEDHMSRERDDKFEFFFNRLEKLLNNSVAEKKNTPRRNSNASCWKCNKKGHVQRERIYLRYPVFNVGGYRWNVTLLRTDLAQKLKEQLLYTGPNISLKTATGEKTEIRDKLDASIECGSRKFHHRIYVADVTDPCILGLDFLKKFNFTVDLEKNEIWTGGEEIPLFSASAQHSKSCSVLAKKRTIIIARSECLIKGVPEVPEQFRYTVTDFPSQVSQKGILVTAALVDLEREAIPVSSEFEQ
ncbi:hypothetical protein AVEN_83662-1 [Araneus ventricosus]|uniref:Uncharacterized protein n=1 Tax=Araneus ventricosus TaxID=182803 RepID=A0A4Y2EYQ7_ARAVE|nr:hypothetical protein AVEN_83662-1 [Araneus ventricosus]